MIQVFYSGYRRREAAQRLTPFHAALEQGMAADAHRTKKSTHGQSAADADQGQMTTTLLDRFCPQE